MRQVFLSLFILSQSILFAQNDTASPERSSLLKQSFGFTYNSFFNAISIHQTNPDNFPPPLSKGLSYRFMPKRIGIQLSALPIGKKNNFIINSNLTLIYQGYSSKDNSFQFLLYLSGSGRYFYQKDCHTSSPTNILAGVPILNSMELYSEETVNREIIKWDIEPGIAMDIYISKALYLELILGYGMFDIDQDYSFGIDRGLALFFKF